MEQSVTLNQNDIKSYGYFRHEGCNTRRTKKYYGIYFVNFIKNRNYI